MGHHHSPCPTLSVGLVSEAPLGDSDFCPSHVQAAFARGRDHPILKCGIADMLKLEPPYKDDAGNRLPVLLDIAPDGTRVYEPAVDPQKSLGERLRRIFAERGHDFFERNNGQLASLSAVSDDQTIPTDDEPASEPAVGPMTPEELLKMRAELLPQLLYVAHTAAMAESQLKKSGTALRLAR